MNDNDRDGLEAGNHAGPENPTRKEPGEFTRLFLATQASQTRPASAQPEDTPPAASSPGEFTRLFASQDSHAQSSPTKSMLFEPAADDALTGKSQPSPRPSFSATGEFAKVSGGMSPTAQPNPQQRESLTDTFPRQAPVQSNPVSTPTGGGNMESVPVSQDILEKAFGHPLAPRAAEPLNLQPNSAAGKDDAKPRGFTQLFSAAPVSAPPSGSLNTLNVPQMEVRGTPSDFTRVVHSSEVRQALEKPTFPAPSPSATGPQGAMPAIPQVQPPVLQYQPPQMPQYPPPQMPGQPPMQYSVPMPQAYAPQVPMAPQIPSVQMPGFQPPAAPQPPPASAGAKWAAYLPILIVINILFMVAVLLILFFALRH